MPSGETPSGHRVRCPRCGAETVWTGNAHRPFCGLTCRLIDLGGWLDERYRVAGDAVPDDPAPDDRPPRRRE